MRSETRITTRLRKKLFEKHNFKCVACGISNETTPLQLAHIIPLSNGGMVSEDNLTVLCPNCHSSFDNPPREIEFVSFLASLLENHPDYNNIKQEVIIGRKARYRADILVKNHNLLIECKTASAIRPYHFKNLVEQLKIYKETSDYSVVLAVPATLRDDELALLNKENFILWDLKYLAQHFSKQIKDAPVSYYRTLLLAHINQSKKTTREETLIQRLSLCKPGKADWYIYQKLVGEILECLFTPPLGKPISELSDKAKTNRRDFIMPNYTDSGFWEFMREKYQADYIVIDAKNYSGKVKKPEVLQLANYLKEHGAGLFGIIISRNGGNASGCENTLREQWIIHKKLILVLSDIDVIEMLTAKSDGRKPEEIVGQIIERFRLSM